MNIFSDALSVVVLLFVVLTFKHPEVIASFFFCINAQRLNIILFTGQLEPEVWVQLKTIIAPLPLR